MTIRIEITGDDHNEILSKLEGLARGLLGGTTARPPEPETDDEPAEATAKPARRSKKATTIEHDPNEGKKADVHADTAVVAEHASADASTDGSGGAAVDAGSAVEPIRSAAATKDESPAKVDAVAEKAGMTINDLRAFTINEYLNGVTDSLPVRKELYGALLAQFTIKAITELPVEKIGEFKAVVDAKIAEAVQA